MAKQITYRDKITNANTVYADIDLNEKLMMLDNLTRVFYDLVEQSNYNEEFKTVLNTKHKDFNKHMASNIKGLNNSLGSFMSGLLKQHFNKPNKDISTKMLKGITLASEVFEALGLECSKYEFQKQTSKRVNQTPFEKLFGDS